MSTLLLNKSDQDTLIFHVWKSLKYKQRLSLSLLLIALGFALQIVQMELLPGLAFVAAANLLLLTKGYDNRLNKAVYKADANWSKASAEQVQDIVDINKKLSKWDVSAVDISNPLGVAIFLVMIAAGIVFYGYNPFYFGEEIGIILANFAILTIPHWFSGIKRISTTPKLVKKIKIFQNLIRASQEILGNHSLEHNLLLQGENEKLPKDIKIRIKLANQPDDFLGIYGQCNMNEVEGKYYPYFYVVLVAKKSFGLLKHAQNIDVPSKLVVETQDGSDVDVIIMRQYTTKKSGYYTNPGTMKYILEHGIIEGERIVELKNS